MHEVSEDADDEEDDVWDWRKIIFIVMSQFFPCHLPSQPEGLRMYHQNNEKSKNYVL